MLVKSAAIGVRLLHAAQVVLAVTPWEYIEYPPRGRSATGTRRRRRAASRWRVDDVQLDRRGTPSAVPTPTRNWSGCRCARRPPRQHVRPVGAIAGYGPAVSAGIGSHDALRSRWSRTCCPHRASTRGGGGAGRRRRAGAGVRPHAASTAVAPAPANRASTLRRLSIRCRSTASPWSNGSSWSWWGRTGGPPVGGWARDQA